MADDRSVGQHSVFDWGGGSGSRDSIAVGGGNDKSIASGDTSTKEGPSSRYDPKAMSRIVDINDLVDDSGDDSDDDDQIVGHSSSAGGISAKAGGALGSVGSSKKRNRRTSGNLLGYGPGGIGSGMMLRQVVILAALVAIIVGASMAIGLAIMNGGDPNGGSNSQNLMGGSSSKEERQNQKLLEIAERVTLACSESALDEDMSGCQKLCKKNMCCFESGKYGCEDDENKNCAVYAGCVNLMEGVPLDAAEEDEE